MIQPHDHGAGKKQIVETGRHRQREALMKKEERNQLPLHGKEHYNRRLKASPIGERARRVWNALRHKKNADGNDPDAQKNRE